MRNKSMRRRVRVFFNDISGFFALRPLLWSLIQSRDARHATFAFEFAWISSKWQAIEGDGDQYPHRG
jgi:hypothetical protein